MDERDAPRRELMRCPCCAKLAPLETGYALPALFQSHHDLDVRTQIFVGRNVQAGVGRGFSWDGRDLSQGELAALDVLLDAILRRIRARRRDTDLIDAGLGSVSDHEFSRASFEYVDEAAKAAEAAATELRFREQEVAAEERRRNITRRRAG